MLLLYIFAATTQAPAGYDFRGIALGTPIEVFRATQFPEGRYGQRTVVCSGDPQASLYLGPSRQEADAGVVNCEPTEVIGGTRVKAPIQLTPEHSVGADYSFYRGRLFRIMVRADMHALSTIEDGLVAKFGAPTATERGEFQTRTGAVFPRRILNWLRGNSAIRMEAPSSRTDSLSVLYLDTAVAREVRTAIAARNNPADAM